MTAFVWAFAVLGIAMIIEGYHGHAIWQDILTLFQGQGVKKQQ